MGVVAAVISAVTVAVLRTEGPTRQRVADANGALLLSAYLPKDVSSARTIEVTSPASSCSNAPSGGTVSNLMTLRWSETINGGTIDFESTYFTQDIGSTHYLRRISCSGVGAALGAGTTVNVARGMAAQPSGVTVTPTPQGVTVNLTMGSGRTFSVRGTKAFG